MGYDLLRTPCDIDTARNGLLRHVKLFHANMDSPGNKEFFEYVVLSIAEHNAQRRDLHRLLLVENMPVLCDACREANENI